MLRLNLISNYVERVTQRPFEGLFGQDIITVDSTIARDQGWLILYALYCRCEIVVVDLGKIVH